MKNTKLLGLIAIAAVIAFSMTACDDGSDDKKKEEKGGTFVLTDIPPKYNGKYVFLEAEKRGVEMEIIGCQKINMEMGTITFAKIENRKVSLPLWIFSEEYSGRYSGNDTAVGWIGVYNAATEDSKLLEERGFRSVSFKNGNATKSWKDGFAYTYEYDCECDDADNCICDVCGCENCGYIYEYDCECDDPDNCTCDVDDCGCENCDTASGNEPSVPSAPTGVTATALSSSSIQVSWSAVSDASSYDVYYKIGSSSPTTTRRFAGTVTGTSYTHTGLQPSTTYYYYIQAKNDAGESEYSTSRSATTNAASNEPSVPPGIPTGVTATASSSSSIQVSWSAVSGASSYDVYYTIGLSSTTILAGNVTGTSYTHTGLQPSTTYYYYIKAKNSAGESEYSSRTGSSSATTQSSGNVPSIPSAPTGVTATASSSSSISVSWSAVSGASSYDVYYAIGSSSSTKIPAGNVTGTSYTHNGLQPSTTYYYYIKAKNSAGESGYSTFGSATTNAVTATTKAITSFSFDDFSVEGTINGPNIAITVPNIVNLTKLVPTIGHNGKSINPESDVAQDFSSPIQYTVTAGDSTTQNYTVTVTVTDPGLRAAFAWINNYGGSTRDFTIVAQANESIEPVKIDPRYSGINISLSGGTTEKTISLSSNGSLFTISDGTLTLDNNITLQGRSSNNASLVKLNSLYPPSPTKLVMNTGARIINNTVIANDSDADGGGVSVVSGTFTMNGGTISGNRVEATSSSSSYDSSSLPATGGGVYVDTSAGTFIMNGGTITNNTAYSEKFPTAGGGVCINGGTFTLVGGTISNNTADSRAQGSSPSAYGGGVAAWTSGTFTMQGGTISGNQAVSSAFVLVTTYYYGGGVYVRNDRFRKTGGTIYGSNETATQQNLVKDRRTNSEGNTGHAVYALVGSSNMRRNATAGTADDMDSSRTGTEGGWE